MSTFVYANCISFQNFKLIEVVSFRLINALKSNLRLLNIRRNFTSALLQITKTVQPNVSSRVHRRAKDNFSLISFLDLKE